MPENQKDKQFSEAFSGELDAEDLAFLSDQQAETVVGGFGCNFSFNSGRPRGRGRR